MMPYILRSRNESCVYFEQKLDLTETLPYLHALNQRLGRTAEHEINLLAEHYEDCRVEEILEWAVSRHSPKLVMTSNFGAEGVVLMDHLMRVAPETPDSVHLSQAFADGLDGAMQALSELERCCFVLKHVEQWKLVEIADAQDTLARVGKASLGGALKEISLAYVPEAKVGDYVLVHVGFAISIIDEQEARFVFDYLDRTSEERLQ